MRSSKGQTTLEMIVVVALILLIFSLALITANKKAVESNDFKLKLDAKRTANSIADNINAVAQQGPGYYRFFSLPPYLFGGASYNVSIYGNFVEITWNGSYDNQYYLTQVVTANASLLCLEKGGSGVSKVFDYDGRVFITCDRPDLLIDSYEQGELAPFTPIAISFDVFNYGVEEADSFDVNITLYDSAGTIKWSAAENDLALDPDSRLEITKTILAQPLGTYNLSIYADFHNDLTESFRGDNWYNVSFTL